MHWKSLEKLQSMVLLDWGTTELLRRLTRDLQNRYVNKLQKPPLHLLT